MSLLLHSTSTIRIQTVNAVLVVSGNLLVQFVCLLTGKTKIANIVFLNIHVIARGKVRPAALGIPVELQHLTTYKAARYIYMGIIDEWYTVFQKIKIPHGLILPVGLMSQTFELSFPAFTLTRC